MVLHSASSASESQNRVNIVRLRVPRLGLRGAESLTHRHIGWAGPSVRQLHSESDNIRKAVDWQQAPERARVLGSFIGGERGSSEALMSRHLPR